MLLFVSAVTFLFLFASSSLIWFSAACVIGLIGALTFFFGFVHLLKFFKQRVLPSTVSLNPELFQSFEEITLQLQNVKAVLDDHQREYGISGKPILDDLIERLNLASGDLKRLRTIAETTDDVSEVIKETTDLKAKVNDLYELSTVGMNRIKFFLNMIVVVDSRLNEMQKTWVPLYDKWGIKWPENIRNELNRFEEFFKSVCWNIPLNRDLIYMNILKACSDVDVMLEHVQHLGTLMEIFIGDSQSFHDALDWMCGLIRSEKSKQERRRKIQDARFTKQFSMNSLRMSLNSNMYRLRSLMGRFFKKRNLDRKEPDLSQLVEWQTRLYDLYQRMTVISDRLDLEVRDLLAADTIIRRLSVPYLGVELIEQIRREISSNQDFDDSDLNKWIEAVDCFIQEKKGLFSEFEEDVERFSACCTDVILNVKDSDIVRKEGTGEDPLDPKEKSLMEHADRICKKYGLDISFGFSEENTLEEGALRSIPRGLTEEAGWQVSDCCRFFSERVLEQQRMIELILPTLKNLLVECQSHLFGSTFVSVSSLEERVANLEDLWHERCRKAIGELALEGVPAVSTYTYLIPNSSLEFSLPVSIQDNTFCDLKALWQRVSDFNSVNDIGLKITESRKKLDRIRTHIAEAKDLGRLTHPKDGALRDSEAIWVKGQLQSHRQLLVEASGKMPTKEESPVETRTSKIGESGFGRQYMVWRNTIYLNENVDDICMALVNNFDLDPEQKNQQKDRLKHFRLILSDLRIKEQQQIKELQRLCADYGKAVEKYRNYYCADDISLVELNPLYFPIEIRSTMRAVQVAVETSLRLYSEIKIVSLLDCCEEDTGYIQACENLFQDMLTSLSHLGCSLALPELGLARLLQKQLEEPEAETENS